MTNIIVKFVNKRNTKRMCEMFSKMFSNCPKYFTAKKKKKKKKITDQFVSKQLVDLLLSYLWWVHIL